RLLPPDGINDPSTVKISIDGIEKSSENCELKAMKLNNLIGNRETYLICSVIIKVRFDDLLPSEA
ncbi:hypothetical protein PFISCL1PPCAC_4170, partial [Pristionchus fissidentatus]